MRNLFIQLATYASVLSFRAAKSHASRKGAPRHAAGRSRHDVRHRGTLVNIRSRYTWIVVGMGVGAALGYRWACGCR